MFPLTCDVTVPTKIFVALASPALDLNINVVKKSVKLLICRSGVRLVRPGREMEKVTSQLFLRPPLVDLCRRPPTASNYFFKKYFDLSGTAMAKNISDPRDYSQIKPLTTLTLQNPSSPPWSKFLTRLRYLSHFPVLTPRDQSEAKLGCH